jgi:acetate kinase
MTRVLAFNPGSNSLKFEVVDVIEGQASAADGNRLCHGAIDDIGKNPTLEFFRGEQQTEKRPANAADFTEATKTALDLLSQQKDCASQIDRVAIRVVHGGNSFTEAVRLDDAVRKQIEERQRLAPLHNANSLRIADVVQQHQPKLPLFVAFDTAFHHSIPEQAWRYPLPRELADKHGIRKFGFHGLSHRYMLERYAQLTGRSVNTISAVTMHLESGSSAAAIRNGKSVETSMGFTPLEGLMMGTRCGSIDPAILPFLMKAEDTSAEDALNLLEKKSGLLGVSGISLDTRILRKSDAPNTRQAIQMFGYRARQCAGAYLAVLGSAEAILFGGGIGENTPEVRTEICAGLIGWGVELDHNLNLSTMQGDVRISTPSSKLELWVIHSEEGKQLAMECAQVQ